MQKLKFGLVAVACLAGFSVLSETTSDWVVTWDDATCLTGSVRSAKTSYVLNVIRTGSYGGFGLQVGWATGNGVRSVDEQPTYLDLRGSITGQDLRADPATNAVWTFSHLAAYCFRPTDDSLTLQPAQWISGLRTPGTLASDGWKGVFHIDSGTNPLRTKEIIVDEPFFTGTIGGWGLNSVGGLTNLVFNCPRAEALIDPVSHGAGGWTTDISDTWDLSSVKYVGAWSAASVVSFGPLSSRISGMTGVLRLPSLIHIAAGPTGDGAAFRCGIGSAELGLNGNLTSLACHSFKDCGNLTNVVIGTALGKTLTVWTNAFSCANLKTIYFNGDRPTFKYAYNASSPAFGLASTPEGQITFYVRDVPSWAEVLAEADANGGFVAGSTLHTANRQKVVRYAGFNKTTVELQDPRFADEYHETVTAVWGEGAVAGKGTWRTGPLTLTAACADPDDAATDPRRAKFLRWDGVPVALERQNPLTFTPTADKTVRAVFAHDWLMTTDAEPGRTMDNGVWRICCFKRTPESDHYLGIGKSDKLVGKGEAFPDEKDSRKGGGDLNLNGDVWEPTGDGTWQKWTVVSCGSMAPWKYDGQILGPARFKTEGEYDKLPTRLTFPETLLFYPGELYNSDAWDGADLRFPITEVICILPHVTSGTVTAFSIGGVGKVSRLVIRAPGLRQLGSTATDYGIAWCSSGFAETDFDEWDLTGVTTVAPNAFQCASPFNARGTLHLPNLRTVGTNAFRSVSGFTGFVAGTNGLTLASIGDNAFPNATGLKSITLGTRGLTLGTDVFCCANLTSVRFPGRALPAATVDAILAKVPESAKAKQVTIYASPFNYWDRLAAAPTAEEAAVKPTDCFGVYRNGLRKAWFVTERSPYEPKGVFLLLR